MRCIEGVKTRSRVFARPRAVALRQFSLSSTGRTLRCLSCRTSRRCARSAAARHTGSTAVTCATTSTISIPGRWRERSGARSVGDRVALLRITGEFPPTPRYGRRRSRSRLIMLVGATSILALGTQWVDSGCGVASPPQNFPVDSGGSRAATSTPLPLASRSAQAPSNITSGSSAETT